MRYLFIHQNFPGQYLHLVRHLAGQAESEVVFLSEPNTNQLPGVRKVAYRAPRAVSAETHEDVREFDAQARRAAAAAQAAETLKALGFIPDIVIGHHGWGELLNIPDVFPGVPLLGYFEFFYHTNGVDVGFDPEFPISPRYYPRIRAKNAVNLLALAQGGQGQTPTAWQRSTYPAWARRQIALLPEGVDLVRCRDGRRAGATLDAAGLAPGRKLVTYVARDLEPYRGFHIMMRALPRLLAARQDLEVAIVGADGVSYGEPPPRGTWRTTMLGELGGRIDLGRVHFLGRVDYDSFLGLLRRSDAHVYLTYPFVASWSLREALAVGCAVVGSDTAPVRDFIRHGRNGVLTPFHQAAALAERVLEVLEDQALAARLRAGARAYAARHLSLERHISAFEAMIGRLVAAAGSRGGR